ncbi:hypothetical protein OXX69_004699 [Metschnikowia pulcherrima]
MILFTVAVALSAWLLFSASGHEKTHLEQAKMLRDFVKHNFSITQEIDIEFGDRGFRFPDLVRAAQLQLDFRLSSDNVPYKYVLVDKLPAYIESPSTETERLWNKEVVLTDEGYVVPKTAENSVTVECASSSSLNITETHSSKPESEVFGSKSILGSEYTVELYFQDVPKLSLDLVQLKTYMAYHLDFIHQNDLPFFLTQAVYDMLMKPDLDMLKEIHTGIRTFKDVTRHLTVNFVAAEESGTTRTEIAEAISQHMRQFEAIHEYVNITSHVHVLDVSKRRAAPNWLKNTTNEVTFFYSTTMKPYADAIQGVYLRHLEPMEKEIQIEGDRYGTEYQSRWQRSQIDTYNVTAFLEEISAGIKSAIHMPVHGSSNIRLSADALMKHYTILGITEILDQIIGNEVFNEIKYRNICDLVDEILVHRNHDWSSRLTEVADLHKKLEIRN